MPHRKRLTLLSLFISMAAVALILFSREPHPTVWLILAFFIGIPIALTMINVVLLFYKKGRNANWVAVTDGLTFILGILFTAFLFSMCGFMEWDQPIVIGNPAFIDAHTPISFEYLPTFFTFCAIAVACYAMLRIKKDKLPPLAAAVSIGGILTGIVLCIVWGIQISENMDNVWMLLFLLFPFNYILCSVRLLREVVSLCAQKVGGTVYKNRFLNACNRTIQRAPGFLLVSFVLILPVLCVVVIILLLFGQTPDGLIKMFTSTADWTLSQQIPPPPIPYEGHYLCTVAAGGDEKVVKPLRIGLRHNTKIIVNRQLCVANAFEDLIKEKAPRFHWAVRLMYDTYGYPLSKHITTRKRANAVYRLMKPLEWLFICWIQRLKTVLRFNIPEEKRRISIDTMVRGYQRIPGVKEAYETPGTSSNRRLLERSNFYRVFRQSKHHLLIKGLLSMDGVCCCRHVRPSMSSKRFDVRQLKK